MFRYYKDSENIIYAYEEDQTPLEGLIPISEEERDKIQEEEFQKRVNALPYDIRRKNEYPPITDYIDGIVKGDQRQIEQYIAACKAVKLKYPKPS